MNNRVFRIQLLHLKPLLFIISRSSEPHKAKIHTEPNRNVFESENDVENILN